MRLALAFTLVASGAVAQDCPTAADLETGIRMTRQSPFFSVAYQSTEHGLEEYTVLPDGRHGDISALYANGLVATAIAGEFGPHFDYTSSVPDLSEFQRNRGWESDFVVSIDGDETGTGSLSLALTGLGEATVGDCTYTVWRIDDRLTLDDGRVMAAQKAFAPDLGLVISSIQLNADGSPGGSVFFDEITAE